jgi:7-cyano-7-deazaguanine reductase
MVAAIKPKYMLLTAKFYVRGGIFTNVVTEHRKSGWKPKLAVNFKEFEKQSNIR